MKPTLYEALGLSKSAAESEIKSALRRLVRRYYARTRAGHADVEEALRFLNHASHILGNPARRAEYDAELAETVRNESTLTTIGGPLQNDAATVAAVMSDGGASITLLGMMRDKPAPAAVELAPEWSAQLAEIRRTRAGQLVGLLVVSLVFLLAWNFALPAGKAVPILKFGLALATFMLGLSAAVFAIVHVLSRSVWRPPVAEGAISLVEGMIPRWRRDRTVFMGTGAPVEDATWLFRLRMAELKRVSAERVSDPQPAMRLFARLFDYAMWGTAMMTVLSLLAALGVVPPVIERILVNPLLAPIWISATWIPLEALLLTYTQTTPGRWLLCVYLHYEVSNPYAPEELRFTFGAAIGRAADVWWRGCGAWLPVVALVTMARAREHVSRSGETQWDSERDCLVTHGPVGSLSLITLALGLAACSLVFMARWKEPVQLMTERLNLGWTVVTARFEADRVQAAKPALSGPQSRINRVDDIALTSAPPSIATATSTVPAHAPVVPFPVVVEMPESTPTVRPNPESSTKPALAIPAPAKPAPIEPKPAVVAAKPAVAPSTPELAASKPAIPTPNPMMPSPRPVIPAPSPVNAPPKAAVPEVPAPTANSQRQQPVIPPVANRAEPALSPIELRDRRVAVYMRQAQRQQASGDFAGLTRTCQRWADEDWRNPRAFYCAGLGLQGIGQHKEAIAMFNKAGALLPRDDPLKTLIGDAVLRSFRAQSSG